MRRCFQDAFPTLENLFRIADEKRIGVYLALYAEPHGGQEDIKNYLTALTYLMKTYFHKHDSFIGIDTLNEAQLEDLSCKHFWQKAYKIIRETSPDCLIFVSERDRWRELEKDDMWPRLSPKYRGIVLDVRHSVGDLAKIDFRKALDKIQVESTEKLLSIA